MSATDEAQAGAVTATCQRTRRPPAHATVGPKVQARVCATGRARLGPCGARGARPRALGWPKRERAGGPYLMLDVLIAPTSELTNN